MSEGQTNNNNAIDGNSNSGNILKELSDIKTSLALNTLETSNIKENVNEVKSVIKEIQKNYITQEQHKVLVLTIADHETRIRNNETNITRIMAIGAILTIIIGLADVFIKFYLK